MRLIAAADCRRQRWRNDGGWTTEIMRAGDREDTGFRWRASVAEIDGPGPFSTFPGVDRQLMLLAGEGLALDVDEQQPLHLQRRFQQAGFAGEADTHCRPLDGGVRVFNAMHLSGGPGIELWGRPLADAMLLLPEQGIEWLVHLLEGRAEVQCADQALTLDAGDSLYLDWRHGGANRVMIKGAGEMVLLKARTA